MIGYRTVMRLAHRYNWHYAPVIGPLEPGDGHDFQRWCKWCGLRQGFRDMAGIEADIEAELRSRPNFGPGRRSR